MSETRPVDDSDVDYDPTELSEGDELEITYQSVYGDNPVKTLRGTVADIEVRGTPDLDDGFEAKLVTVDLICEEDDSREVREYYVDIDRTKQVVFDKFAAETWKAQQLNTRNGYRWNRLSKHSELSVQHLSRSE